MLVDYRVAAGSMELWPTTCKCFCIRKTSDFWSQSQYTFNIGVEGDLWINVVYSAPNMGDSAQSPWPTWCVLGGGIVQSVFMWRLLDALCVRTAVLSSFVLRVSTLLYCILLD